MADDRRVFARGISRQAGGVGKEMSPACGDRAIGSAFRFCVQVLARFAPLLGGGVKFLHVLLEEVWGGWKMLERSDRVAPILRMAV